MERKTLKKKKINFILVIRAYSSWKSKIQCLKILEYVLTSITNMIWKKKSLSSLTGPYKGDLIIAFNAI